MTALPLHALIFDVDGTLADTEHAHLEAFNEAFAVEGLDWHWDLLRYTELLNVSGGKERIQHHWRQVQPGLTDIDGHAVRDTIDRIHGLKTAAYEARVRAGRVTLRPGVLALMEDALRHRLKLAIATTTSPANIAALLRPVLGDGWANRFAVVEDASTAPRKKPDPQVYRQTLQRLGLSAASCVTLEDSANGLQAALAAGLATVITPTGFTQHHDFTGALRVLPDLDGVDVAMLRAWHAGRQAPVLVPA